MLRRFFCEQRTLKRVLALLFICLLAAPAAVLGKGGGDRDRLRFYGWVEAMPENLHGTWIIGGRRITTGPGTEFDEEDGLLRIGSCAKVDIRNDRVHEIESEPARDCRQRR